MMTWHRRGAVGLNWCNILSSWRDQRARKSSRNAQVLLLRLPNMALISVLTRVVVLKTTGMILSEVRGWYDVIFYSAQL